MPRKSSGDFSLGIPIGKFEYGTILHPKASGYCSLLISSLGCGGLPLGLQDLGMICAMVYYEVV